VNSRAEATLGFALDGFAQWAHLGRPLIIRWGGPNM
jgi:hypothetical protein